MFCGLPESGLRRSSLAPGELASERSEPRGAQLA